MTEWWLGLPAAQVGVTCAGQRHRLRWEEGELRALDHEDAEGERALAALGGERCTCIDVLDAWHRHAADPHVLVLGSRGPGDRLPREGDGARLGVPRGGSRRGTIIGGVWTLPYPYGWTGNAQGGLAPPGAGTTDELIALLLRDGGLPDRLVATVAAAWRERLRRRDPALERMRPQLGAALYGRVMATMGAWLGRSGLEVQVEMIPETRPPRLTVQDDAVRAELPFGWLVDVWAKGLATIYGRFCLAASTSDGRLWELSTVTGPDFGQPATLRIELPSDAPS